MARKYEMISRLFYETLKEVAHAEKWEAFLKCASRNFRLRFDEQVLIYAQRSDATAVLEIEKWNNIFGRWVNKGAKGIAVFEDIKSEGQRLTHYFDISDTHATPYSRAVPIWRMQDSYKDGVIETLENTFGNLDGETDLAQAIIKACHMAIEDNIAFYQNELFYGLENLYASNEQDRIKKSLVILAEKSMAYMIMERLDIKTEEYFNVSDFQRLHDFENVDLLMSLGQATSDITKMALNPISKTIRAMSKENRTFDKVKEPIYNEDEERSDEDERNHIQQDRRLSDTGFTPEPKENSEPWQMGTDETKISEGESSSLLLSPFDQGDVNGRTAFDTRNSQEDGRRAPFEDDERRRNKREAQGERYDEVGANAKQPLSEDKGDRDEGSDLELEKIKPLLHIKTQQDNIKTLQDKNKTKATLETSPFLLALEDIEKEILRGSGFVDGKYRIFDFFKTSNDAKERADFLKKEYGIGGWSTDFGYLDHSAKGLEFQTYKRGEHFEKEDTKLMSWSEVSKRIAELIKENRYLNDKEKEKYLIWSKEKDISKDQAAAVKIDNNLRLFYKENDKVYLGGKEYEIQTISDDKIVLFDKDFPLFTKELNKKEFEEKILENPLNDHLLISKNELANALLDFKKEYDFYDYGDNTDGDESELYLDTLSDLYHEDKIEGMIDYLDEMIEESDDIDIIKDAQMLMAKLKVFIIPKDEELLNDAKAVIDEFCNEEYGDDSADYSDLKKIPIAYTNTEDERFEIQVYLNLKDYRLEKMVDGRLASSIQFHDLKDMYDNLLISMEFGDLIYLSDEELKPFYQEEKNYQEVVATIQTHQDEPLDFDLKDHQLEYKSKKERYIANIEAIKIIKRCKEEGRHATKDEQKILAEYAGWGSLSEAFDERNESWLSEYLELKKLLDEDEYASAKESTLSAFYTPQSVIKAMYKVLANAHFKNGNILEPSCGVGNFIGMLPEEMKGSKFYAIELDSLSASIAKELYQSAKIVNAPYESVELRDNFFDVVIGNVPFGDFKVYDKRYDKQNFLIHDYFFAKSLDKLRPGGILALITSKGTMDKENENIRRYIGQRAELLGAIRLPNDTFSSAGTEVVSDILFLQKRDRLLDLDEDWYHLATDQNGIKMNSYFVTHPEMILGEMKMVSGRFGETSTCIPYEENDLEELLNEAIINIQTEIDDYEIEEEEIDETIIADPNVRNFSYTIVNEDIYYRENSRMRKVEVSATAKDRIIKMIALRDKERELIALELEDAPNDDILKAQSELNKLYDEFNTKYGLINSRANANVFSDDSSYSLLAALEILDENGNLERKADMFYKRTIKPHTPVLEVETASKALTLSIGEKGKIDIPYMESLCHKDEKTIYDDLKGVIFLNPDYDENSSLSEKYLMADEYLSGNVREKLRVAKKAMGFVSDEYRINYEALKKVLPKDLSASEIEVRLGATWFPKDVIEEFMYELFETPRWFRYNINVNYFDYTGEWNISSKSYDRNNIKVNSTYGTSRMNAYKILEETLNLKDVRIFDYETDDEGKKKAVLNKKETAIAQGKQEAIKNAFKEWVFKDPKRRERLAGIYNERFNSIRPREYDGSHITFNGMNPEIILKNHQRNAVAHILYGGNTLLAHAVGAGKTFEMVAANEESRRLGLSQKAMFVVPNHLIEQWASEYLWLYPGANILVTKKKDFEMKNRKKFCARIATGDYDAIIIGHSQFEKIPMSLERQKKILERQIDELTLGIADLKKNRGENFSIKQLEKSRKSLKTKLEKLNDQSKKDDVVTFEELGVDRLFIDESHYFKNLYLYTKMRNVGGIAQTEAQKSSDLFMKCQYLDEITGGKGVIFATGTPISNSMVELYTIQRYLQYHTLQKHKLTHFDAWASTFGETITAIELNPEGTGYRTKTRFAKFYNLPELMSMFKEVADIQTADMLKLPVPNAHYHNISTKPSDIQKAMVRSLSERADKVRAKMVSSSEDNMLKITNDGRKLALDQRLINDMLPDEPHSKVNACVDNVYDIYQRTSEKRSTQLIFCDLSTPKNDGSFNVYDDIKKKLILKGVKEEEIKFIHEADSEAKKKELFLKVRKGDVRILLGSTAKMGAGTNVQDKLIAMHDLDCPWRPSDLEQRSGRIIRQGNENSDVDIYRYVTEETFDAYLYQLVEGKQRFASQIMTSKSPVRSADDIDETALSYAEIKMLATGNPHIKEKMDLDIEVSKLKLLKANFLSEKYALEDKIIKYYPLRINALNEQIKNLEADINTVNKHPKTSDETFIGMKIKGVLFSKKDEAGKAILEACKKLMDTKPIELGEYRGLKMDLEFDAFAKVYVIKLKGQSIKEAILGDDVFGNITRIDNAIEHFKQDLIKLENELSNTKDQLAIAQKEVEKPFDKEEELNAKTKRLDELNILLNMDKKDNEIDEGEINESEKEERKEKDYER